MNTSGSRLTSLDVYRGFVMLLMASELLRIPDVARSFPHSAVWRILGAQMDHSEWTGCRLWDLIQPSFLFLVGAALAYSYAKRKAEGQSYHAMLRHACIRSLALIGLGLLEQAFTNFTFEHTLTQIGLGYMVLFLLCSKPPRVQLAAPLGLLAADWAAFALYPLPHSGLDYRQLGFPTDVAPLRGFAAHWSIHINLAARFDLWFLNLIPRPHPYLFDDGGYQTINFIPSISTMIFGLLTGELLRSDRPAAVKLRMLVGAGVLGLAAGIALHRFGLCPMVKRIWTPSWTLFSAGWACLFTALFYGVIDGTGHRRWIFPFQVVGMNSIVMYFSTHVFEGLIFLAIEPHLSARARELLGGVYSPLVLGSAAMSILWLWCYWLYRHKRFLRL